MQPFLTLEILIIAERHAFMTVDEVVYDSKSKYIYIYIEIM